MNRPLWQIVLSLMLFALAVQRAAAGYALGASAVAPGVALAYGMQALAASAAAAGIWLGRSWAIAMLLVLGAMLAGSALLEGFWLDLRPAAASVSEMLIVVLTTGALVLALRRELGESSRHDRDAI